MAVTQFRRNQIVVEKEAERRYRLLSFDTDPDQAWLISLDAEDATPLPFDGLFSSLESQYAPEQRKNDVALAPKLSLGAAPMLVLMRDPTPSEIAQSQAAWKRIEPLVGLPGLFEPSERNRLLIARSKELKGEAEAERKSWKPGMPIPKPITGTPKTLLKDLRDFWRGGQTQDALLGRYANCGRMTVVGTGNRGRKNDDGSQPYQAVEADFAAMRNVIETFYFEKGEIRTLTATLAELHARHYTYEDGNGTTCLKPRSEAPTYRQLGSFLKEHYPLETRLRKRKGDKEFERNHRATLGSVQLDCHGVGHIYEFDATIFDVQLVSSKSRAAIVGKPTVYLIIDRASRMIVGFYVGFENASYTAAMQAILSIGQDKQQLCRELGIAYDPEDWIAHLILPESFLADQGELTSKNARRSIARSLRTTISNVPGLRPDWKPLVECGFKMLPQIIAPHTPGYSPDSDNRRRRAPKHDKDACLTLQEFQTVLVSAIISHNRSMQVGFPLSFLQVADGVPPIPLALYAHGIRREIGKLDLMDFERVRAEVIPRSTATITQNGLKFGDIFYTCPEAEDRGWFVEGRRRRKPTEIAFDYRLVDQIIVYAPDGSGESFVAELTGDSVIFESMSFADVARHFYDAAQLTAPAPDVNRQARFAHNQFVKPLLEKAHAAMKIEAKGVSRSSRKKDVADDRADELDKERNATAGVVPRAVSGTPPAVSAPVLQRTPAVSPPAAVVVPSQPTAEVIPFARATATAAYGAPPAPGPTPPQVVSPVVASSSDFAATTRPMTLKERLAAERKRMLG
jgi:putative transposase